MDTAKCIWAVVHASGTAWASSYVPVLQMRREDYRLRGSNVTQQNPRILVAKAFALGEAARVLEAHRLQYEAMHLPPGVSKEMVHYEFSKLINGMLRRRARILEDS